VLLDIVILIGLSQGIIFGITLISGKIFKDKVNRYLALAIIIMSVIGFNEWAIDRNLDDAYYLIDFFGDDIPWILLVYVPTFIYFQKSLDYNFKINFKKWLLTIPFLIFLVLNIIIDLNIDFFLIDTPWFIIHKTNIYIVEYYTAIFYTSLLCAFSYFMLVKSTKPKNTKKWLKWIWIFYTSLIVIWNLLVFIPKKYYSKNMDFIFWIAATIFFYWLIYKGLLQFYLAKDVTSLKTMLLKLEKINNNKSDLTKIDKDNKSKDIIHLNKLKDIVEREHLYRNPDLSLTDVAKKMQLSPGYLSQLINTNLKISFTGLINTYRVEEVKKLVMDESFEQYSLLAIGLEAGFKSKSAYYTLFKKETGLTPNEYKKSVNKS
jgi:AraC-like DNA-binding protein